MKGNKQIRCPFKLTLYNCYRERLQYHQGQNLQLTLLLYSFLIHNYHYQTSKCLRIASSYYPRRIHVHLNCLLSDSENVDVNNFAGKLALKSFFRFTMIKLLPPIRWTRRQRDNKHP